MRRFWAWIHSMTRVTPSWVSNVLSIALVDRLVYSDTLSVPRYTCSQMTYEQTAIHVFAHLWIQQIGRQTNRPSTFSKITAVKVSIYLCKACSRMTWMITTRWHGRPAGTDLYVLSPRCTRWYNRYCITLRIGLAANSRELMIVRR